MNKTTPAFAPQLYIPKGVRDVDFYVRAFGAVELRRFSNTDGTVHVAEFSIDGAVFQLHEVTQRERLFDPEKHNGTTVLIGLFVSDVHSFMERAVAAGAVEISPAQDYDYGYRQGVVKDPFGHQWMIEQKI